MRSLKKLKMKKVTNILETKEKIAKLRRRLENTTREAFEDFKKPVCINTKTIVFD